MSDIEQLLTSFFVNTSRAGGVGAVVAASGALALTRQLLDGPLSNPDVILFLADRLGIEAPVLAFPLHLVKGQK